MKKKMVAIMFAVVFAFISIGTTAVVVTNYIDSNVAVVEAALTTSQTRAVQTKLKRWGYYTGGIDGIYGNQTRKAVRLFQKKNRLAVDGITARSIAIMINAILFILM